MALAALFANALPGGDGVPQSRGLGNHRPKVLHSDRKALGGSGRSLREDHAGHLPVHRQQRPAGVTGLDVTGQPVNVRR